MCSWRAPRVRRLPERCLCLPMTPATASRIQPNRIQPHTTTKSSGREPWSRRAESNPTETPTPLLLLFDFTPHSTASSSREGGLDSMATPPGDPLSMGQRIASLPARDPPVGDAGRVAHPLGHVVFREV